MTKENYNRLGWVIGILGYALLFHIGWQVAIGVGLVLFSNLLFALEFFE